MGYPCLGMLPGWKLPQLGAEKLGKPMALASLVVRKTRTSWSQGWKAPIPLQAVAGIVAQMRADTAMPLVWEQGESMDGSAS